MQEEKKGILYIVSTPIGNLEDITLRALRILKEVDLVAAEDTRRSRKLLSHYDIHTPLISFHEYSKRQRTRKLVDCLREGKSIALISDAGTPCISDPGVRIVREAVAEGVPVEPVPGASVLAAVLSICGLPVDRFVFEGFLDGRTKRRQEELSRLKEEERSLVFFESPHRLIACLEDMHAILGNRQVCIARELTKKFEEVIRGDIFAVLESLRSRPAIKGEITFIVEGAHREKKRPEKKKYS
ncbi:MAG: 16S rRNA (cytidine(1402)-2'-O)-methyltransferase [bacterium]